MLNTGDGAFREIRRCQGSTDLLLRCLPLAALGGLAGVAFELPGVFVLKEERRIRCYERLFWNG